MFSTKDLRGLKNLDRDDLLELVGLQTRKTASDWVLPTLGAFSVGLLVGAGLGLLLAPKPGHELRHDLRNRLQGATDQLTTSISGVMNKATAAAAPHEPQAGTRAL